MIGAIDYHLKKEGYRFLKVQPQEAGIYYRYIDGVARVIIGLNAHDNFVLQASQMELLQKNLRELFLHPQGRLEDYPTDTAIYDVQILTLVLTGQSEKYRILCANNRNTWMFDLKNNQLIIYENQPGDFYGLRAILQKIQEEKNPDLSQQEKASIWKRLDIPIVGTILVLANIVVFLALSFLGDTEDSRFMVEHGAMFPPFVTENGEWYRLFTAMFLHFGALHLLNNMVMLFFAGKYLEHAVGKIRYLVIYLVAGLGGNLFSMYMMMHTNELAVSAGASGAIFGVIGALLWVAIKNRGRFENLTTRGLLLMIALCLYFGFSTAGVDNWCHVGGLLSGFLICFLLYRRKKS